MRSRRAASGIGPSPARMFWRRWSTREVAGIAQVTAGCETMNFSTSCAQPSQPSSPANPGSGCGASARSSAPWRNGRLAMTVPGHVGGIGGLAFGPDARRLVSVSDDGTMHLWQLG